MKVVNKEHRIEGAGEDVWAVLADFGNFLIWATGGAGTAKIEGEGVGMIRHLEIPGLGQVSERLDSLDHPNKLLAYSMVSQGMAGMAEYAATVRLESAGEQQSRLIWRGEFKAQDGLSEEEVAIGLAASYDAMAMGLKAYVGSK
jgi:carbon monoxide dehydrogenase subunit G